MLNAPLIVSRIFGEPALRPAPPIWISFVGVKIIFVLKGAREMSVKLPTTVADGEFNAKAQRSRDAKDGREPENFNHGWTRIDTDFLTGGNGGNREREFIFLELRFLVQFGRFIS